MPAPRQDRALASTMLLACALAAAAASGPPLGAQPDPRTIEIVARRFAFEPSLVEVRVGERVVLAVRSADGVHGFAIEPLDVKETIPRGGKPVLIEFSTQKAGRFPILCSEYCGKGHEEMKGELVVQAADVE